MILLRSWEDDGLDGRGYDERRLGGVLSRESRTAVVFCVLDTEPKLLLSRVPARP